jgi:DNA invertase Pin-like site-specific DNA recombinase
MTKIGYARTSTSDQVAGLEKQIELLKADGCEKIFQEQVSSVKHREALEKCLQSLSEGDTLVVTTMSRLVRSTSDLCKIQAYLEEKKVFLKFLDLGIDTSNSAVGKMFLVMLSAFAQFEREIMIERQKIGIAKAKVENKYDASGRPATWISHVAEILELSENHTTASVAYTCGVSAWVVRKVVKLYKQGKLQEAIAKESKRITKRRV